MKKILILIIFFSQVMLFAQEEKKEKSTYKKIRDNLYGSFETNAQWYLDDKTLNLVENKDQLRANSYLTLNYSFLKKFTAGIQVESYEPTHLKNFYDGYKKTNISNYFLNYKTKKIDITLGHYYEQFGSGLILRAYEERSLGLNNALRGAKVSYTPFEFINLTALYGRNRYAFKTAESDVFGFNTNIYLSNLLNISKLNMLNLGFSYVGRKQTIEEDDLKRLPQITNAQNEEVAVVPDNFPELVNAFSVRGDIGFGGFYTNLEFVFKGQDVSYFPRGGSKQKMIDARFFTGNAFILTTGYTQKGLGITATLRRLENMSFYAKRSFVNPADNQYNMLGINYLPALVKEHGYSLTSIYIYQAQPGLLISGFDGRAGEIGGQLDFFYMFSKGSSIGGKYGTKIGVNYSYWSLLKAEFAEATSRYNAELLNFGKKLYNTVSVEINKKWSKKLITKMSYIHSTIDKGIVYGKPLGFHYIDNDIAATETIIKFRKRKSLKIKAEHLWTKQDNKNWAAATIEANITRNISLYASDMYNYGNDIEKERIHYYNFGLSFTKNATRITLNYGRQRGGLTCVGGVCRYVSANSGFMLSLTTSF